MSTWYKGGQIGRVIEDRKVDLLGEIYLLLATVLTCPPGQFNFSMPFKNIFLILPSESSEIHQNLSKLNLPQGPLFISLLELLPTF